MSRRPVDKRQSRRAQTAEHPGSNPGGPTNVIAHAYKRRIVDFPTEHVTFRNSDYKMSGSRYTHIEIWSAHHGIRLAPNTYVIHHIDEDKHNNDVCDRPAPCGILNCGNLAPLTRADHIREHRPGKMSGQKGFVDTKKRKSRKHS